MSLTAPVFALKDKRRYLLAISILDSILSNRLLPGAGGANLLSTDDPLYL